MKIKWDPVPDQLVWNKVKSLRRQRGLKQIDVAAGSGTTITTVWNIEQGYERRVSDQIKQKLADFFECDIDDIFPCEMVGNQSLNEMLKEHQSQKD